MFVNEAETLTSPASSSKPSTCTSKPSSPIPGILAIYIAMAGVMVFNGDYEEARKAAEDALILNPDNSMAHAVKGWALSFSGDYLEAEGAVTRRWSSIPTMGWHTPT